MNKTGGRRRSLEAPRARRNNRLVHSGLCLLLLLLLCFACITERPLGAEEGQSQGQSGVAGPNLAYDTIFYKSGDLRIEAYLYRPKGDGPFPLVIYNHGSRQGQERQEVPFKYVAGMFLDLGYAVLVPERRGYGKSDGKTLEEEAGNDLGGRLIKRLEDEAGDVLAGLEYAKSQDHLVPPKQVAMMGWSHGGVVSILAAERDHEFVALVDQAGGALTWKRSKDLRKKLTEAAGHLTVPVLCQDAENDATTEAAKAVCDAAKAAGNAAKTIIYPSFSPPTNRGHVAPGHLVFSIQGAPIWKDDTVKFVRDHIEKRDTASNKN
jgi:dienelactone hydrolase